MSTISFYNSDSISSLFSSLNNTRTSQNMMFSGIDLNTYNSIKSGGYSKLMKAYYAKQDESAEGTKADKTTQTEAAQKTNATTVRDEAAAMVDAAKELQKASLWSKETKTDAEGKTSSSYKTDEIYKAVSEFADAYNSLIAGTGNSSDDAVLRSASNMVSYTKRNSDLLKSVGIGIGSDNKLKIDEDAFKKADMAAVRSLFKGQGSFAMSVSTKASSIYSSAVSQLYKLSTKNTYTADGTYNYMSVGAYNKYL